MKARTWSYSSLKNFKTCPRQYHEIRVLKNYQIEDTEATRYGTEFHKAAELFVQGTHELPAKFDFALEALTKLKEMPGKKLCEYTMGLTEDLEPCAIDAHNVWWRGVADLVILQDRTARVIDYKTGASAKYADKGQLELMAMAIFKHFPDVDIVRAGLLFVVANSFPREIYHRAQESQLWDKWLREHRALELAFKNDIWNPRESGLCRRHCIVESCVHNGSNR
jgi:hypothetical protein